MKTTIIFSILLLPAVLMGQVINHFDHADSKWNVAKTYPDANQQNPSFVATTTTVYGFQGDTLINNEHWFKLYSTSDSTFQNNLLYRGLLRSENNKVLYLDTLNQLDTLYDFSLNVGDSALFNINGTHPEWLKVDHVDNIQINGEHYKRLKFEEPSVSAFDKLDEVWIEGIGSIHGPLFPAYPVKFSEEIPDSMLLTCSYSDQQPVWQNPSYQNCYINIVLGVDQLELANFNVYPNPFTDKIKIENNGSQHVQLSIMNSLGQTIRETLINSNSKIIDLSDLNAGVYFLRIKSADRSKTLKLIKKH